MPKRHHIYFTVKVGLKMPRPGRTISASSDFSCSSSAIWRVLTREEGYKEWFGYPKTLDLSFIEPEFVVGARLSFKGYSSLIITELKQDRLLSFSNNSNQITISLVPYDEFVDVTMTVDILSSNSMFSEVENIQLFLRETLRALKKTVGVLSFEAPKVETKSKSPLSDFLTRVFAGYMPPIANGQLKKTDEVYSNIIDNTEAAVTISKRALMVAAVLICLFFFSIGITLTFQRSDIVPSSGLSLFENDSVNKYISTLLRVGNTKEELESKLSCSGKRKVNIDSSIEFHYESLNKDENGNAYEYIYVIYDAYGKVRRYAYLDVKQSQKDLFMEPSNGKLKESLDYYELTDKNILLSPSMNLYEVEEIIGLPVSAYVVDKNGDSFITTYYFGTFQADDIFTGNYKSQIVVTLNDVTGVTDVSYYNPISSSNPLPLDELTRNLRRQYAGLNEYLSDRFAYEKIFLLNDISPSQVELILATKGIPINTTSVKPTPNDNSKEEDPLEESEDNENIEEKDEEIVESFVYRTSNPVDTKGSLYRNFYSIEFHDSLIYSVSYRNTRLGSYAVDTLGHLNNNSFYSGMSYDSALAAAGVLPSAAEANSNIIIIYFGQEMRNKGVIDYPLKLTFVANSMRLVSAEFYQAPDITDEDSSLEDNI